MPKKFNGMENFMLQKALESHVKQLEADILHLESKEGKRSMIAPGYFTMIGKDLSIKLDEMTIKAHLKKNERI